MSRFFWTFFIILCLSASAYLLFDIIKPAKTELAPFAPSPEVRVQLKSNTSQVHFSFQDHLVEIWLPEADRPYQWKGDAITISRESGEFKFSNSAYPIERLDLIPKGGRFEYNDGTYPGNLRLISSGDDSMQVINIVELEPYVARVVDGEMYSHWPLETLKAQAIAARTFALYQKKWRQRKEFDLYASSRSQAYSDENTSYRSRQATLDTQGVFLSLNGRLFLSYYLNTCGGKTFPFKFGSSKSSGVNCGHCNESPFYQWQVSISLNDLNSALQKHISAAKIKTLRTALDQNGKTSKVIIITAKNKEFKLDALSFRRSLNQFFQREKIKSLVFAISQNKENIIIDGKGWGYHGYGLCQYGAKAMGEKFYSCLDIISTYYPEATLTRLPPISPGS
ncbi:MAG: SpoIID/LytB domain-containing protein [Planctomycetes bacterium]|nr:SpoIID/LytB domain-containing protein [Planctomycetota bacterium]